MEALDARRKKIGTKRFNQEFLHIPLSNEDSLVELTRIVQKNIAEYPKAWIRRLMCIDPAQKDKTKNDYSGFVHIGVAQNKKRIISSLQVKLKPLKLLAFSRHLYKIRGEPEYILKEDNIETTLTETLASEGYPIIGIRVHKSKRERLLEVSPEIERGEVIFREEGDEELIKQLTEFPDVANDDIMDAATL